MLGRTLSTVLTKSLPRTHIRSFTRLFPLFHKQLSALSSDTKDTLSNADSITKPTNQNSRFTLNTSDNNAQMMIAFNCSVCETRNQKQMSKQAYTHGVVIIKCEGCGNNHLIADNKGWFPDAHVENKQDSHGHHQTSTDPNAKSRVNIEDLMRAKGEAVTRGQVSADDNSGVKLKDIK